LEEIWKDIDGFTGYQVSNLGRVRTFRKKKHYPTGYGTYNYISDEPKIMHASDDGDGYLKVMLYADDGVRYCRKVHKLVANAFIPKPESDEEMTVDHIKSGPEGKLDNSVSNLRWLTRGDNIRKAYSDGMLNNRIQKSRKMIVLIEPEGYEGEETRTYFGDIKSCADYAGVHYTAISHLLNDYHHIEPLLRGRWYVELVDPEEESYFSEYFYDEEGEYHAGPYYCY
jgi:hypothetical protein